MVETAGQVMATRTRPVFGRFDRPTTRTTFQIVAELQPQSGQTVWNVYEGALRLVLGWLKAHAPGSLPKKAWDGEDVEYGDPSHRIELVGVRKQGLWAARLIHPDAPFRGKPAVAGRSWTTDIGLAQQSNSVRLGLRVICTSQPFATEEIDMTRPKIVLDLARQFAMTELRPLDGNIWNIESDTDLLALQEFLTNPCRTMPVVVLTQPDARRLPGRVRPFLLDHVDLGRKMQGFGHVVTLPRELSFNWTEMVGRPWSVFGGAVRTYRPGLDLSSDSPSDHPLAMAENVLFWRFGALTAENAFSAFLIDQGMRHAAFKRVDWGTCLFFTDLRTRKTEIARKEVTDKGEWQALYESELTSLKTKIAELENESQEYNDDAMQAAKDRDFYTDENNKLRAQIDMLRVRLAGKTNEAPDAAVPIPDNYPDMPDWVSNYLIGRLVLHSRALRGIADAAYEDVGLVYRSLLLLANEYRDMKLGQEDGKKAFDKKVNDLGIQHGPSITKTRAGEEGDAYFVQYPVGSGRKQFLDLHLRKRTTKDDRYCLAIYFFWDDQTRQVVVGWLPSHLDTRAT